MLQSLPAHMRGRREKCFGDGRPRPLDRNGKARLMVYARALMRRSEPGKHYGQLTAKVVAVLEALLWGFHNARSGLCFPSYERIAERAGCARSTVAGAIKALEGAGVLTWCNRIKRVRVGEPDLFGRIVGRWRVLRTSNGYRFLDPRPPTTSPPAPSLEKNLDRGFQTSIRTYKVSGPDPLLAAALQRLKAAVGAPMTPTGGPTAALRSGGLSD